MATNDKEYRLYRTSSEKSPNKQKQLTVLPGEGRKPDFQWCHIIYCFKWLVFNRMFSVCKETSMAL